MGFVETETAAWQKTESTDQQNWTGESPRENVKTVDSKIRSLLDFWNVARAPQLLS